MSEFLYKGIDVYGVVGEYVMTGEKIKGRFTDIPANIRATIEDMRKTSVEGALIRHADRFGESNRKLIR